ncbi:MAG: DUF1566 domain-containing protein [Bacteroidetes bacterium]|nr:DUF1566 domain-containing protein [Bacteroidota bacterium]
MNKSVLFSFLTFSFLFSFGQEKLQYKIGDFVQGGVIFWLDQTGQHGLVCATSNQGSNIPWDTEIDFKGDAQFPPDRDTKSVAIYDGVYAGKKNTEAILKFVNKRDKLFAALICDDFVMTQDSFVYDDWYLPSREELNMLYLNREIINEVANKNGGESFDRKSYWSSTDVDCSEKPYCYIDKVHLAWGHNFSLGGKTKQSPSKKYMPYLVRAIRSF